MQLAGSSSPDFARAGLALLIPAALIGAVVLLLANPQATPQALLAIVDQLVWVLLAAGVLLAWRFNRSGVVFALLTLAAGHAILSILLPKGMDQGPNGQIVFAAFAILAPINLVVFPFLKERGLLTEHGGWRLVALTVQAGLVWALASLGPGGQAVVADLLHWRLFSSDFDSWTWLPQPAIIVTVLCLLVALARLVLMESPLEAGTLGAVVATAGGLHLVQSTAGPGLMFAAGAVILLISVLQESYRMAFLDELTGLPGRRALQAEMMKLGGRYSVAMLDVDHFKKFNDTYGHDVGDQVLRMVAGCMKKVPGGGKAFRYGGEEFTVLFPGKFAFEAVPHLEILREAVAASGFTLRGDDRPEDKPKKGKAKPAPKANPHAGKRVNVTISIGVSERGDERPTPGDVIKAADEALYRAKEGGRNRVSE